MDWTWLWQGVLSNAAWWFVAAAIAVVVTVLRKRQSMWLSPILYGLIGGMLFGLLLFSSTLYARWPLATPLIFLASLIIAGTLQFASVLIEQKRGPTIGRIGETAPDHSECQRTIGDLKSELTQLRAIEELATSETYGTLRDDHIRSSRNQINQYVRVLDYGVGPSGISEAMPYIDLWFKLLNVSIFPLTISDTVQGTLRLNNKPMSGNIKVRTRSRDMGHNGEFKLSCRQWLSKEESNYILNEANDSEEFSFCDLEIMIRGVSDEHAIAPQLLLVSPLKNKTVADLRGHKTITDKGKDVTDSDIEHAVYKHAGVMFQLLESDRRLVFFVNVFNALAHEIKIADKAEGFILCDGKPFHKKPTFSFSTLKPPDERMSSLGFHQEVSDDEFNAIQKAFADGKSVSFDFDSLYLYVEVKGKRHRLRLPDGLSCKPGINYVEVMNMSATIEI